MPGRLVYLMGPSGVGKDTLLAHARRRLDGTNILFAHRYVTRLPVPGDENFISLSPHEFETRRRLGLFLFDWTAHGTGYGVGREVEAWLARGAVAVVSGSRAHYTAARPENAVPVLVTAPPEIIAARLASRGREDEASRRERLAREADAPGGCAVIDNSGGLETAGDALVALHTRVAAEIVPAP